MDLKLPFSHPAQPQPICPQLAHTDTLSTLCTSCPSEVPGVETGAGLVQAEADGTWQHTLPPPHPPQNYMNLMLEFFLDAIKLHHSKVCGSL